MGNVIFIKNPASFGGASKRGWDEFCEAWGEPIDPAHVVLTEYAGHAREIAASVTGYDMLVAVGGDGTVGEIISGIMAQAEPRPKLAIIPCGTGNDIARSAGILSIADAVNALRDAQPRALDLIRVARGDSHRYSFLFANAGFSVTPMLKPWMKRFLGATPAYYLATLLQVFRYRAPQMNVCVDGKRFEGRTFMVVAANAEYAGGGCMRIAPEACTDDGELNISIIGAVPRFKLLTQVLSRIASGQHVNEPEVKYFTGNEIEIQSDPPALVDMDGELFGTTPITISVCPQALKLVCPAGSKPR